jgi:3-deoxy-D-manno-octulosonic-acid transferase
MALALSIYSVAMRLATPLWLARLWWRGRAEPLYRHAMGERLGFGGLTTEPATAEPRLETGHGPAKGPGPEPGPVWIHAVSLGETHAAGPLIDELRRRCPGMRMLLTHSTATGRAAGAKLLREGDVQAWLPIDTPGATRRFLMSHRPRLGILMETEVWPNLIDQARRTGVPMVLANARLSERSLVKGLRWKRLLSPAVAGLEMVLAQTEDDARRLRIMGARDVKVCGNLKFDVKPDPTKLALGRAWRAALNRPVVLAASTREGEEAMLLDAWVAQVTIACAGSKSGTPGFRHRVSCTDVDEAAQPSSRPLLVIVPRHPQRFDEVDRLITQYSLNAFRRSQLDPSGSPGIPATVDVLLGDSMGEMPMYYGLADAALLGGSFGPYGGQNLLEAAMCGCPIWMGPHVFNFDQAARAAVDCGAAFPAAAVSEAVNDLLTQICGEDRRLRQRRLHDPGPWSHGLVGVSVQMAAALGALPSQALAAKVCGKPPTSSP